MNSNKSFLSQYGLPLIEKGYPIVPIKRGHKFPKGIKQWGRIEAKPSDVNRWLLNGFSDGGVGVLSRFFPAVDIDVRDEEIVKKLIAWCEENIGQTVQRVGDAPKTLLVYRTEDPFTKITSKKYEDFLGVDHKLEILGEGQQFVAFAVHPESQKPYQWVGPSLLDIAVEEIPIITTEVARELIAYFESIVPEDWVFVEKGQDAQDMSVQLSVEDRVLLNAKPKIDIPEERLIAAVKSLDPDIRMNDWVKAGMGLFHQYDGDERGFSIWDEWSSQGVKYISGEMRDRWDSFKEDLTRQEPTTAATILLMAKKAKQDKIAKEVTRKGFQLVHASDIVSKLGPIDWQVKNYFEANTTGILFGDPGSYKSFIALDVGIHCALGREWHGNPVKQGPVIYVAGEGHGGFARRLAAFEKANDLKLSEDTPLYFSQQAASLYNAESAELVTEAIDDIANATAKPAMIIIDTLARNFGAGDENSTSDMNVFIEHVDRYLRSRYECTVLIVHHTGHANKERARGSMALKGALDFEFRVDKPDNVPGYKANLVCTKMKDAVEPPETWFEGESVVVGNFDDDEMTSLVFKKTVAPIVEEAPLKGKQKSCFDLLKESVSDGEGIEKKAFHQMLVDAEISTTVNQARPLVHTLIEKDYIIEFDGFVRTNDFFE